MKKTFILCSMASLLLGATACKKNYVCYCDNNARPATSYIFTLEHTTHKKASKECMAASNDDPTNVFECTIEK